MDRVRPAEIRSGEGGHPVRLFRQCTRRIAENVETGRSGQQATRGGVLESRSKGRVFRARHGAERSKWPGVSCPRTRMRFWVRHAWPLTLLRSVPGSD